MDFFGDIERFERSSPPASKAAPAYRLLTVERIRGLLARQRDELKEIRARAAATERYQETGELLDRLRLSESKGHPDAPDLWRLPHMLRRLQQAHLWDARDPLPAMLGTPEEWENVRALQDEIATAVEEHDAVVRAVQRRRKKLEEAQGPPADDAHVIRDDDPEAVAWLRSGVLAGNAFGEHEDRAFVERLYAAGAERVVIASECIETSEDPPHSDGLRVKLPKDRAARTAVLKLIRKHAPGFKASDDVRWDVAFIWWD
jgi:hypothetical protein